MSKTALLLLLFQDRHYRPYTQAVHLRHIDRCRFKCLSQDPGLSNSGTSHRYSRRAELATFRRPGSCMM